MEKLTGYIILTPAYGRDYKSKKEVLKHFLEGKDFIIHTPTMETYTSIRDIAPGATIQFRYKKLTQVAVHKMK